jgi:RNA polymerase sigma-70 factor (ECF subfamily)
MVDVLKKEKRTTGFEGQDVKQDDPLSHLFDVQKTLQEAVNKLPEIQKTVILLRDYEGYNYNEIAEITALNESQVKVYIFRARQTLKNYLKSTELVA